MEQGHHRLGYLKLISYRKIVISKDIQDFIFYTVINQEVPDQQ